MKGRIHYRQKKNNILNADEELLAKYKYNLILSVKCEQ